MSRVWTMGEILVEIMRPRAGMQLYEKAEFLGPFPSGAPAIFIDTVARLGHSAGIIGGVGNDDFGRCVLERLKTDGVDVRFVKIAKNRPTATAFVTYFQDGSRKFIFHINGTAAVAADFPAGMEIEQPEFFHVMGCSLMADDNFRLAIFKAVDFFFQKGTRITFDPNIRPELLGGKDVMDVAGPVLKSSSILFPGEKEMQLLTGENDVTKAVKKLFKCRNLEMVVLKKGRKGATIFSHDSSINTPVFPVKEIDPTGAGDCFDAGFLCGLLEGKPVSECGRIAAAAGALNAAAFGPMEAKIDSDSVQKILQG